MTPFHPRLRAAAIVPRWSIVQTVKPDYLAGHSFFVALYSLSVIDLIKWEGPKSVVLQHALLHDLDELITGDLVSPVKREVVDDTRMSAFVDRKMQEVIPHTRKLMREIVEFSVSIRDEAIQIVKAADALDALFFALGEQLLGNAIIGARIPFCLDRLQTAWFNLPMDHGEYRKNPTMPGSPLCQIWAVVLQAIDEHKDARNYDLDRNGVTR